MRARRKSRKLQSRRRGGFALPDVAALTVAAALFAALILAGASATRHHARAAGTQAQLRWVAGVTQSYAADNQDRLWGFSWTKATTPGAGTEWEAAAMQASDLLRRRANPDFYVRGAWVATQWYSHLPLADYLDITPPMLNFVSPQDAVRLRWARDPDGFARGDFLPLQPDPHTDNRRWIYSSSYQTAPHMSWDPVSGPDAVRSFVQQWTMFIPLEAKLVQRRIADFAFPSQKVHTHGGEQFSPRRIHFTDPAAQVSMLMIDGAAAINRTGESNLGWGVLAPGDMDSHEQYIYEPRSWEPPTLSGEPWELVPGRYRFTRGGPAGRDFDGPEIDTRE